jgi:hypothetical protein
MAKKETKETKERKKTKTNKNEDDDSKKGKPKLKKDIPELVVFKEDDLRQLVTETVTKLMAEDVLDMDDNGIIDLKEKVELKKKAAKRKKKEDKKKKE